jgi:site-specific recombinase XerD
MSRGASEALLAQFEEYLIAAGSSRSTVVNYLADLRALARWAVDKVNPKLSLAALTPDTIEAYCSHLLNEKRCAVATVNRRLHAMRKFCTFAVQTGLVTSNPAEGIQPVQDESSAPATPLTAGEIGALLEAPTREQPHLARRDRTILMLLLHTGLRVNELVDLCLDHVQFDHPGIHLTIEDGRGSARRQVPLEGEVRHALYEYLSVRPNVEGESHLFLTREGRPLSIRSVQRIVSDCARAAGLEGVSAQVLRRTFANRLLASTGDLSLVSRRLGHQSVATTVRYMLTA